MLWLCCCRARIKGKVEKKPSTVSLIENVEFAQECLQAHNEKRALHNAPPLRLSKKLCKYSEEWARHLASQDTILHRPTSDYGENLFMIISVNGQCSLAGSLPVEHWYNEISKYVYGRDKGPPGTGHFTQVVWVASRELGVAKATSKTGKTLVVCNYNPRGNVYGAFTENVPPLGGFSHQPRKISSKVKTDEVKKRTVDLHEDNKPPVQIDSEFRVGRKRKIEKKPSKEKLAEDAVFALECLLAHNEKRALHKAPPLRLNEELSKYSEEWAQHLASIDKDMFHRPTGDYGENIYTIWSKTFGEIKIAGKIPVDSWYDEISMYVYGGDKGPPNTGHFTQVVWVESEELGVGKAVSKTGRTFVVCNYKPAGNVIGAYTENVPPVGGFTHPPKTRASQVKNDEEFQEEMVKVHNEYRLTHRSPPVRINKEMNDYAQEWAVHLAKEEKLEYRFNSPYGQNILQFTGRRLPTAKDACTEWYSGVKDYNYKEEATDYKAGDFTQMVWRSTEEIGVGRAKSKLGSVFIVVLYKPRGNVLGNYLVNVLKP